MASDARQRMIRSAALLFRERGVEGTSFTDVLAHSRAPRGSIYHHFPGGKAQLVEEATRYAGDFIARGLVIALAQDKPMIAIRAFAGVWRSILRDSDFAAGCPIVAATLEGDRSPAAREAAAQAFDRWRELLADAFRHHGVPRKRATSLAVLVVASIEGAVVMARASRSTEPLEQVVNELEKLAATLV